jgi:HK97 gp10 family phage protein
MRSGMVITGIRNIDRKLKRLEPRLGKKILRQALRAGLKIIQAEVKAQVPVKTGATRKAVQVRAVKRRKRGGIELECRIAASSELKRESTTGKTVFYPAIVQYGRKGVPPDPFMTRAYQAKGEVAKQTIISVMKSKIDSVLKSL